MTYNINFSDPLRDGFQIPAGAYNGPGSTAIDSSLRLYGRGALEWGESVDENMLRLNESWAGATPPPFPLEGQVWYQQNFYWLQTGVNWFAWDPNTSVWGPALTVVGTTVGTDTPPPVPTIGSYWYTAAAPTALDAYGETVRPFALYEWNQQYEQTGAGWLLRAHSSGVGAPSGTPLSELKVCTDPNNVSPLSRFTKLLTVDGSGNLDMGGYRITNLGNPVNPGDALNLGYADGRYVNITGDTMTGSLVLNGQTSGYPGEAATVGYVAAAVSGSLTGYLPLAGGTMTGSLVLNADPVVPLGAATKQYVDTAVGGVGGPFVNRTGGNQVYIGWTGVVPAIQIDATPQGYILTSSPTGTANQAMLSNFQIGDAITSRTFTVYGTSGARYVQANNGNLVVSHALTVGTTIYAGGDITAFSDITLKEDIEPIQNALEVVKQWVGILFTDKATKEKRVGFVADNIAETAPRLVKEKDGKKALAYQNMTAYLAEAIKTLDEKLERVMKMLEENKK